MPAFPPLRLGIDEFVDAPPPSVVIAPTLRSPVVAVSVTAEALLPTPSELLAPLVVTFCSVMPLAAVTVTKPEAVPVSVPAVVMIFAPEMAVTAPEVAFKMTLPPEVVIESSSVMLLPVIVTIPLA